MDDSELTQISYRIIGAAMEVYNKLGNGFNEYIYQDALALEFITREIPFEREKEVPVFYKGTKLKHFYKLDFLCFKEVIVEVKAISEVGSREVHQVLAYLKATGFRKLVLVNFGTSKLYFKSYVL